MKEIEEIWEHGNVQIEGNNSFQEDAIQSAISESSESITAGLGKPLIFGMLISALSAGMFIYNSIFYRENLPLLIIILLLILVSLGLFIFLWGQVKRIGGMDLLNLNLHDMLVHKISYLNGPYNLALHAVSLSIVFATFTINLTMENGDGIFEFQKIAILSGFYVLGYLIIFALNRLSVRMVDRQLKNALRNLEEQSLRSLGHELRRHRRRTRIIALILGIIVLLGIAVLVLR